MQPADLIAFEEEIKQCYLNKEILAPIHLRNGCEEQLIDIFKDVGKDDYVLCSWASHLHALLKGIPREKVKQRILDGLSISLAFPEHRFFSSGIVGNLVGAAVGLGMAIKEQGKTDQVWVFIGDMTALTGIVWEAMNYTKNFDLNVNYIVEDNDVSVLTDTKKSWNATKLHIDWTHPRLRYFHYKNDYPHSGVGKVVQF